MSDVKMSDVFPYAFQVEHNKSFEVQDAVWYSYGEKYESDCDQDSAIERAVLSYDQHLARIAELEEGLRQIADISGSRSRLPEYVQDIYHKASELLEQSNEQS